MAKLDTVTLKAIPWKVLNLASLKRERKIYLPDLQRGFVWSAERVRALHDSLYRRYPVGALLLWKPTWEGVASPFATRAWDLFPPDQATGRGVAEAPAAVQPGSLFVLDGQQRLTSLFRVVFRSRVKDRTTADPDLLVALSPHPEWADNPFWLRSRSIHRKMQEGMLVPAEVLFEGVRGGNESLAVQQALGEWVTPEEELFYKALDRANAIRNAILQAEIIAYEIDADAGDDNVIEIFARLNQQGVRLRPGDLAAARLTGVMADFRGKAKRVLRLPELKGFAAPEGQEEGVRSGGFVDTDILIRASLYIGAGVIRYRDVEKRGSDEPYRKVEQVWDDIVKGFCSAVELYRNAGVPDGTWLPYRYLLLPPAVCAAAGQPLGHRWIAWAILASLWRHYVGEVDTKLETDAALARKGDLDGLFEYLKTKAKRIESAVPEEDDFTQNIVSDGGVFLGLLVHFARGRARSFPGKKLLQGTEEPLEVHHIFPRAVLDNYSGRDNEYVQDRLGNLTLITRSDNEHLADTPPDQYLPTLDDPLRAMHLIAPSAELWSVERYKDFCEWRERELGRAIRALLAELGVE